MKKLAFNAGSMAAGRKDKGLVAKSSHLIYKLQEEGGGAHALAYTSETSKATSGDILSPTRPCLIILPQRIPPIRD